MNRLPPFAVLSYLILPRWLLTQLRLKYIPMPQFWLEFLLDQNGCHMFLNVLLSIPFPLSLILIETQSRS